MASPTLADTAPPNPRPRGALARLVRQHEQLEELIAARRSHGLSTREPWLAMVKLEDKLADEHPAAFAHWIAIWAQRRSAADHLRGQTSAACPLCQQTGDKSPQPVRKIGRLIGTERYRKQSLGAPQHR